MVPDSDTPRDDGLERDPGTEGSGYCDIHEMYYADIERHNQLAHGSGGDDRVED